MRYVNHHHTCGASKPIVPMPGKDITDRARVTSRLVQLRVDSPIGDEDRPALPRRRETDLSGLAMFTMDQAGRLTSWSPTAAGMFGREAAAVVGRHLSEVLLTGPGQESLV